MTDPTPEAPAATVAALEAELVRIKAEIHAYPGPIAGCDAQFNHLLDRRAALLRRLAAQRDRTESAAPQHDDA
ncbi:MAG: hypothetical protein AAF074_11600 [Pseudomonadota bacterium]